MIQLPTHPLSEIVQSIPVVTRHRLRTLKNSSEVGKPYRAGEWPASGPGTLWRSPWSLTRVCAAAQGSSATSCTYTWHFSPVLIVLRSQSRLMLEGRTAYSAGRPRI